MIMGVHVASVRECNSCATVGDALVATHLLKPRAMSDELKEGDLIARAVAGDRVALQRLLLRHSHSLQKHVASRLPSSLQHVVDQDDVIQQVLIRVYQCIGQFEPQRDDSFWAWLKTIADSRLAGRRSRREPAKTGRSIPAGHRGGRPVGIDRRLGQLPLCWEQQVPASRSLATRRCYPYSSRLSGCPRIIARRYSIASCRGNRWRKWLS